MADNRRSDPRVLPDISGNDPDSVSEAARAGDGPPTRQENGVPRDLCRENRSQLGFGGPSRTPPRTVPLLYTAGERPRIEQGGSPHPRRRIPEGRRGEVPRRREALQRGDVFDP